MKQKDREIEERNEDEESSEGKLSVANSFI